MLIDNDVTWLKHVVKAELQELQHDTKIQGSLNCAIMSLQFLLASTYRASIWRNAGVTIYFQKNSVIGFAWDFYRPVPCNKISMQSVPVIPASHSWVNISKSITEGSNIPWNSSSLPSYYGLPD
jgi:hypothetical protein